MCACTSFEVERYVLGVGDVVPSFVSSLGGVRARLATVIGRLVAIDVTAVVAGEELALRRGVQRRDLEIIIEKTFSISTRRVLFGLVCVLIVFLKSVI